jgi:PAS domain S-box-containing protein
MLPGPYLSAAEYLARALKGEAIPGVELRRPPTESSPERWMMCSYQPAFDEGDEVIGISASVLEVTDHRRAQEELRESALLQRHLIELNQQTPWMMDAEGNNLQVSSSWVLGVPEAKQETRNLGWLEALHEDDLKEAVHTIRHSLSTGEPIDMEYRVKDTEGEWRWMRSRGLPRFGPSGEITRWYGSVEDIHERKLAENERVRQAERVRSLLSALPVAVIVGKGRDVVFKDGDWLEGGEAEWAAHDLLKAGTAAEQQEVLDVFELAMQCRAKYPTSGVKVSEASLVGLEWADDARYAARERERLVSLLERHAGSSGRSGPF